MDDLMRAHSKLRVRVVSNREWKAADPSQDQDVPNQANEDQRWCSAHEHDKPFSEWSCAKNTRDGHYRPCKGSIHINLALYVINGSGKGASTGIKSQHI